MAGRGVTIKVERQAALRALASVMREKQRQFKRDTKNYPLRIEQDKKKAAKHIHQCLSRLLAAKTSKVAREAVNSCDDWHVMRDLFSEPPTLNLCSEENFIKMLQMDTRKTIPINSNSLLWTLLEPKCEIIKTVAALKQVNA